MMKDKEKLQSIINEIDQLVIQRVDRGSPEFQAWKTKAEMFLREKYGEDSYEAKALRKYSFTLQTYAIGTAKSYFVEACVRDLKRVKAVLSVYLENMEEDNEIMEQNNYDYSKVFIVHGHNDLLKESIARLIEKQKTIKPIILHERPNIGATTLIEKIENNSDINAAICLFTSDDFGKEVRDVDYKYRARQNVVFETGYFIGKLGRKRVIIVAEKDVEIPSDLSGVVYTNTDNWKFDLLKELKAIGYNVDYNRIDE